MDRHRRLIVGGGREDLALSRRDGRIPFDELGEHATEVSIPRERGVTSSSRRLSPPFEDARLDRSADANRFVGLTLLLGSFPKSPRTFS